MELSQALTLEVDLGLKVEQDSMLYSLMKF